MIFFTSDTHFADPRILSIDRRPFPGVAEHDAALIRTWNDVVDEGDDVWHLGDFMSARGGDCDELLGRLHGHKHLIIGNNDLETTTSASGWQTVQHYRELAVDGLHLVLCHYAFRTWNKMANKSINLHGHSHGKLKPFPRQFDVGVDAQAFRPVTLDQIISKRGRAPVSAR